MLSLLKISSLAETPNRRRVEGRYSSHSSELAQKPPRNVSGVYQKPRRCKRKVFRSASEPPPKLFQKSLRSVTEVFKGSPKFNPYVPQKVSQQSLWSVSLVSQLPFSCPPAVPRKPLSCLSDLFQILVSANPGLPSNSLRSA